MESQCTRHAEDTNESGPREFVWVFDGPEEGKIFLNDVVLVLLIGSH